MQTNNKCREALKLCIDEMCNRCRANAALQGDPMPCLTGCEAVRKAKAALAEPVKNCEVGTAEEQYSRMFRECYEWMCMDCKTSDKDFRKCALSWAQKPYPEGDNDADKK